MHNADHWETLIKSVVSTLPSGIDERLRLLDALLGVLPKAHHRHAELLEMRGHLNRHVTAQRELALSGTEVA
jgi:hypothetical protein